MKKSFLLTLITLVLAIPAWAEDRHQSYLSYDDGGTVVRSGDDGRELDAHRNLPVYPGDEIVTARRGRAEVRLSDGNIIGIDRTTALRLRSILDAYEGDSDETVVELRYGKVAVHRTDIGRDHVRLDTDNASYVAYREALYSVETDSRQRDRVTVFEGSLEVRTPQRTTRLRAGESVTIDDRGLNDLVGDQRHSADDFERWFLQRADRFENYNNRYVDRRLGHWADDLDDHGRWVFVTGIGWSWRPYVAVGWRPYYNGYWHHGRGGSLVWVSYDPWGWGTHHYGRWAFDPGFGWVWVPGYGYSPAWVYWTYGSGYVGWAPAGWWDCYRPYYNWAYQPYRNYGVRHGFGFYGRVRVNDFDLRPWTFVDSNTFVSTRIDRAALTTDAVKARMARAKDGYAPITGGATRFTREEMRNPAEAIRRRGLDGRDTGRETGAGAPVDLTPFVRRDPEVGGAIRDRLVRTRGSAPAAGTAPATAPSRGSIGGGTQAPAGGGGIEGRRAGGGESGRIGRGGVRGEDPAAAPRVIEGGRDTSAPREGGIGGRRDGGSREGGARDGGRREGATRDWRDRLGDRGDDSQAAPPANSPATAEPREAPRRNDGWRTRVRNGDGNDAPSTAPADSGTSTGSSRDVPRRVIDGIGGARVVPRDSSGDRGSARESGGERRERGSSGASRDRGSAGSSRDRGDSGGSSRVSPPPPAPSNSGGSRDSGGSRGGDGGNRSGGGRIERDRDQ